MNDELMLPDGIYIPRALISAAQAVILIRRTLLAIGEHIYEDRQMTFIKESERTAYIAVSLAIQGKLEPNMPLKDIFLLSLFSNIGAYRFILPNSTSSIHDTAERDYTYSYYFLKYMSPFGANTKFLLFHNSKYNPLLARKIVQAEYAHLIFFAANVESYLRRNGYVYAGEDIDALNQAGNGPDYAKLFLEADKQLNIVNSIRDDSYISKIDEWSRNISYNQDDTFKLVKMLIYIMDFKSTATVTHTINTACFAAALGQRMNCGAQDIDELYTAGILHDIGKMAVPSRILECPAKLSREDMEIMRTHVEKGIRILHNVVPAGIEKIASRHHEKLDGSGYPEKLSAKQLSLKDRILTIADITSALTDIRSYKDSFSGEKTIRIITGMTEEGQLDPDISKCVAREFDSLKKEVEIRRKSLSAEFGRISAEFQAAEMTENL
jgi:putative nucleotidyltransferase with HDIG domain